MSDPFQAARPTGDCLSFRQIGQIACGDLQAGPSIQVHLDSCDDCRTHLADEQSDVRAAAYAAMPADLVALGTRRSWSANLTWLSSWGAGLATATLACVLWISPPAHPDRFVTQTKGAASMLVSVQRSGDLLVDGEAAETVHGLRSGDKMRLRVLASAGTVVTLQGMEGDTWKTYFEGQLPSDGWLPMGLRVTGETPTRLRLVTCASGEACQTHLFNF